MCSSAKELTFGRAVSMGSWELQCWCRVPCPGGRSELGSVSIWLSESWPFGQCTGMRPRARHLGLGYTGPWQLGEDITFLYSGPISRKTQIQSPGRPGRGKDKKGQERGMKGNCDPPNGNRF